jgi:hypothetical protein
MPDCKNAAVCILVVKVEVYMIIERFMPIANDSTIEKIIQLELMRKDIKEIMKIDLGHIDDLKLQLWVSNR